MREFPIRGEYIELGQFLKAIGATQTGGEVRRFLADTPPRVNGEPESRRGRKLRPGDTVALPGAGAWRMTAAPEGGTDGS